MSYVTNGLIMYLDAEHNVDFNIHDPSATIWQDLSGNGKNGTIYSATWEDRRLSFNGSSSWVNCGQTNLSYMTLEIELEYNVVDDSAAGESNTFMSNAAAGGYTFTQKNGKNCIGINIDGTWYMIEGSQGIVGKRTHLAATFDGTTLKLYENGELVIQTAVSGTIKDPSNDTVLSLGSNPDSSDIGLYPFNGYIYSARVYNRALSAEEIYQNYRYVFPVTKYLIRIGENLYTIINNEISVLEVTELTSEVFSTYGFDSLPSGTFTLEANDPELLQWYDSEEPPELYVKVTGVPPIPQIVITESYDMSDPSILGIDTVTANVSEDVLIAISFDEGITWNSYDGTQWNVLEDENSGMTKSIIDLITPDVWGEIITSTSYKMRFVLPNTTSYVTSVVVDYLN